MLTAGEATYVGSVSVRTHTGSRTNSSDVLRSGGSNSSVAENCQKRSALAALDVNDAHEPTCASLCILAMSGGEMPMPRIDVLAQIDGRWLGFARRGIYPPDLCPSARVRSRSVLRRPHNLPGLCQRRQMLYDVAKHCSQRS